MERDKFASAVKNTLEKNIYYHSLALEACMGGIYDYLSANNQLGSTEPAKEDWLLAGLIHDIDYYGEFKTEHPNHTIDALRLNNLEISQVVHDIVKSHAPTLTNHPITNKAGYALFCADSLTGLITAVAFVIPSRKLADVKLSSVIKRFLKEPKFAAGTRREEVKQCESVDGLNIPLEKFIELCLASMQSIASEIEL